MAFVADTVEDGIRLREFTIDGGPRPVTGALWHGADGATGSALVCFGHGASGDRFQQPIPWLVAELVGGCGFAAMAIDGPVHGRRKVGDGARKTFWPEWQREGTVDDMNRDWEVAIDFARSQAETGAGPIGYWGLSMGTIYGAPLVASDQRITAAVLGLMGISGPDHYRPTITAAARNITVPVLFIMQLEDELFSRDECLALFDELATTDKRLHASSGGHVAVPMEELHQSATFLADRLAPSR